MLSSGHGDTFSKTDEFLFSFFYPLYNQQKHPGNAMLLFLWGMQLIEMFSLAFFRVDMNTGKETGISNVCSDPTILYNCWFFVCLCLCCSLLMFFGTGCWICEWNIGQFSSWRRYSVLVDRYPWNLFAFDSFSGCLCFCLPDNRVNATLDH
jgi:hypothetical protein